MIAKAKKISPIMNLLLVFGKLNFCISNCENLNFYPFLFLLVNHGENDFAGQRSFDMPKEEVSKILL